MKNSWWSLGTSLCFVAGCAGTAPRGPSVARGVEAPMGTKNTAPVKARALEHDGHPGGMAANGLASQRLDDAFAVSRQVTALERSIELYETFIARAGDDPHFTEAVERSRDRIDDARIAICFLLEKPCDESNSR